MGVFLVIAALALAVMPAGSARAAGLTVSAPSVVPAGATVTISGTGARAGETVGIWFHRKGQPATYYDRRRLLTASSSGTFSTTYVADTDYRYYATTASMQSPGGLTQLAVTTISGPDVVTPGTTVTISGETGIAASTVAIWFHSKSQPAGYFERRRVLTADQDGRYTTTYVADTDYRYYAVANKSVSPQVLTQAVPDWLYTMNSYRAAYGVGQVDENPTLSAADAQHVSYMYNTGQFGHSEDPSSPYYTASGSAAASRSNVAFGPASYTGSDWVNLWTNGPFHGLGILRPTMRTTGFAAANGYAALDVLGDLSAPDPGGWPKSFPSARAPFTFRTFASGEYPDPLSACPSSFRSSPVSAPLMVSLGPAAAPITSASVVFGKAGQPQQTVCVLTERNYVNAADSSAQSTGRSILAENHTVVVFAASPLASGTRYSLHLTPDSRPTIDISFVTS